MQHATWGTFDTFDYMKGGSLLPTPCRHIQHEVNTAVGTVYATGLHDVPDRYARFVRDGKYPMPDAGVYLAPSWKEALLLPDGIAVPVAPVEPMLPQIVRYGKMPGIGAKAGKKLSGIMADSASAWETYYKELARFKAAMEAYKAAPLRPAWPALLVDWEDHSVIDVEAADALVSYILDQVRAGKRVEIGCVGAHGRTGVLLAMLLIEAEGLPPDKAINEVRARHCRRAIEGTKQVRAVFGFGGTLISDKEARTYT